MVIKVQEMPEYQPERGYSKDDWDAVFDNPPMSREEMEAARPFKEAFSDLAEKMQKAIAARGRHKLDKPKNPEH
ncbi:hypothetical protein HFN72_02975 [Rhizobium laguerreae]|uniref:hypothetical protein n=1 Tax=Rhizobium laguerreae TaxID=1076926 RepID=UPI001C90618D|nr:hypothetical protein [Rhizobium laguerreae]MBY3524948.1 hypothetical protein [Rhizobium laguerreae]